MTTTRWQKGQSGNPRGRKPGTGAVAKLRESIGKHVPSIITAMVKQAKKGDAAAARLLLERAVPALKLAELPTLLDLPATSLSDQGRAVVAAAGQGALAPGQAAQLLNGLAALARLVETDELAARIKALEEKHADTE